MCKLEVCDEILEDFIATATGVSGGVSIVDIEHDELSCVSVFTLYVADDDDFPTNLTR